MLGENMNLKFRLKKIDETRNCLTEETNWKELISKKHNRDWVISITHLL